jgi:hypothetical protein
MGSVRTSILGRPRRLPRDRRAGGRYTLNCEEAQNQTISDRAHLWVAKARRRGRITLVRPLAETEVDPIIRRIRHRAGYRRHRRRWWPRKGVNGISHIRELVGEATNQRVSVDDHRIDTVITRTLGSPTFPARVEQLSNKVLELSRRHLG